MSRLAGRVTFPGKNEENEQEDAQTSTQENSRSYHNPTETYRSNQEDKPKPRGKGNVRYQETYSNKFDDEGNAENSSRRNQGSYDQRSGRSENNSRRFQNRNDGFQPRNEGYGHDSERHDNNHGRSQGSERFQNKNDRSERSGFDSERYEKPSRRFGNPSGNFRRGGGGPSRVGRYENSRRPERDHEGHEDQKPSNLPPTKKIEDAMPFEELLEVEDIIAQISDLNVRNDRSAAQIKRNILGSNDLIDTMEESDWEEVCQSMISTALDQGEPEFISDLIVALFANHMFSAVMSDELMSTSSKHIMEDDDKPIPALLSAILCAHWPRQYAKAFDNVNPILYTVVCIVKGWIEVVGEDTERYHKEEPKPKYQTREDLQNQKSEDKEEIPESPTKERIVEEPEMVNLCALALSDLCDTAQKQLWVNWMSLTDEIYQCIKPSITHNPNLTGDVKARLLDTFIQMSQWTKHRQVGIKHAGVQTVPEEDNN
ncbi:hypothetical protein L3Y34_002760 [Caenorhabditis briggsae]|uniref:DUF7627 domain-containing protein n=2 Tax=Caenorhabditis briggsae TaxID=6238 RepID=A0AAE9DFW3_CAEBR|nr:hypothetical protein L3Y34_002760 [Caenorhabditis briggsae]